MNISPVQCNSVYLNNRVNNNNNIRRQVSFTGSKTAAIAEKSKDAVGCLGTLLALVVLAPLALLARICTNKNEEIGSMMSAIQNEYTNHTGDFRHFESNVNYMNKFLDKHTKNENYAQFVREATNFLLINFKNNRNGCDTYPRLKPFMKDSTAFIKFIATIQQSAQAAVSKDCKGIDLEKLNTYIQEARQIMQQASNNN